MKRIFLFCSTISFCACLEAAEYFSIDSGIWHTDPIWSSTLEGTGMVWDSLDLINGDTVYVKHDLSIDLNILTILPEIHMVVDNSTLTINGKLKLQNVNSTLTLIDENSYLQSSDPDPDNPSNNEKIWIGNEIVWTSRTGLVNGYLKLVHSSVTPITLSDFSIFKKAKGVLLTWKTLSERNFDFFTVERSHDAINYSSVGSMPGSGWSQTKKEYEFSDPNPLPGLNFYRLRSVDFDGYTELFPPLSFYNVDSNILISTLVKNRELSIYSNTKAKIEIINVFGETVVAEEIIAGPNSIHLSVEVVKGVYILMVINEDRPTKRTKIYVE